MQKQSPPQLLQESIKTHFNMLFLHLNASSTLCVGAISNHILRYMSSNGHAQNKKYFYYNNILVSIRSKVLKLGQQRAQMCDHF